MPSLGAVGSRSILRDSLRRLGDLRKECGKGDGPGQQAQFTPTGDPFADRLQLFRIHANACKEAINDRADNQAQSTAQEQTDFIRADAHVTATIDTMAADVDALEKFVAEANEKYYEAEKKKKGAEKIQKRLETFNTRNTEHRNAVHVLEQCRKLARTAKDRPKTAASSGGTRGGVAGLFGRKDRVHAAMEVLRRSGGRVDAGQAQTMKDLKRAAKNDPYGTEMEDIARLEDSEYRDQYSQIQEQRREIDRGLERLSAAVSRIRQQMVMIGDELDSQNKLLEETQERVADQAEAVRKMRKQTDKVLKKQSPRNLCVNVFCFMLLLALIGYLLVKFKAV